jgi:hypothetical protein
MVKMSHRRETSIERKMKKKYMRQYRLSTDPLRSDIMGAKEDSYSDAGVGTLARSAIHVSPQGLSSRTC